MKRILGICLTKIEGLAYCHLCLEQGKTNQKLNDVILPEYQAALKTLDKKSQQDAITLSE